MYELQGAPTCECFYLEATTMFFDASAPTTQIMVSLASILLVFGIYKISTFVYDEITSPLRRVPGPPSPSFIYGNFKELAASVSRKGSYCGPVVISWTMKKNPNRMIPRCMTIGSIDTEQQSSTKAFSEWVDRYPPVPRWLILLAKVSRLMTTDLKAINYILFNTYDYPKPEVIVSTFQQLFGMGT